MDVLLNFVLLSGLSDFAQVFAWVMGVLSIVVAAIAWLARKVIEHWLSNRVELHKADLKASGDHEIERFKSELLHRQLEHEVRFRRLHEKQAEIVAETYSLLLDLFNKIDSYVGIMDFGDGPDKDGKIELANEANLKFSDYFFRRRIYLPRPMYERIRDFYHKLTDIANEFTAGRELEREGVKPDSAKESHWMLYKQVRDESKPLFEDIHDDFQRLLGVDLPEEKSATSDHLVLNQARAAPF